MLPSFGAKLLVIVAALVLAAWANVNLGLVRAAEEQPFGIDKRIPWTTSRLIGSPDPPLPYSVEKTFTKIKWQAPIYLTPEPGTDSLLVVQQGGEKDRPSKILRLRDE